MSLLNQIITRKFKLKHNLFIILKKLFTVYLKGYYKWYH